MRMVIGTSVALPFELSCTRPKARGPLSFLGLAFFCGVGVSGTSCCALLETGAARSASRTMPMTQTRYKIVLSARRGQSARVLVVDLDFSGKEISMNININDKAPEFSLQDENGKEVSSKDLQGKTVVLYFYPRADTPG